MIALIDLIILAFNTLIVVFHLLTPGARGGLAISNKRCPL